MDYVTELIQGAGVAVVPGRGFFHQAIETDQSPGSGGQVSGDKDFHVTGAATRSGDKPCFENYVTRYIRIAFCKDMTTLKAANTAIRKHPNAVESNA